MGRRKVSPEDIRETLDEGKYTIAEIAKRHGIHRSTVRKRFKALREVNIPIVHDCNGNFILRAVETEEEAEALKQFLNWVLSMYKGTAILVIPTKKLMPGMARMLKENMEPEERRELSKLCTRIRGLIEQAEVEEELES